MGGYSDWLQQRPVPSSTKGESEQGALVREVKHERAGRPRKRSYKEQRELDVLPDRIEQLEAELDEVQQQLSDPAVYEQMGADGLAGLGERLKTLEESLEVAYARWEELE